MTLVQLTGRLGADLLSGLALPAHHAAALEAALHHLLKGEPEATIAQLTPISSVDCAAAALLLGLAHLARTDLYRAVGALKRAVELAPHHFPSLLSLAKVHELRLEVPSAAQTLRSALSLRPDSPAAIAALARCHNLEAHPDRAEALARRGLETHSNDPELLAALANSLRRQERHAEAVEVLERAVGLEDSDTIQVALGRSLLAVGDAIAAIPVFDAALRLTSESMGALAGMAEALEALGRLEEARGYALRALAIAPDRASLRVLHARLSLKSGRYAVAERAARLALSLDPADVIAARIGLRAAVAVGSRHSASELAETVLNLVPNDAEALATRGTEWVLEGRAADALRWLVPLAERRLAAADVQQALGCARLALGQSQHAARHFIEVVRRRAGDARAQLLLGLAYRVAADPTLDRLDALRSLLEQRPTAKGVSRDPTLTISPLPTVADLTPPPNRLSTTITPLLEEVSARQFLAPAPLSTPNWSVISAVPAAVDTTSSVEIQTPDESGVDLGQLRSMISVVTFEPTLSSSFTPVPEHPLERLATPTPDARSFAKRLRRLLEKDDSLGDLIARTERLADVDNQTLVLAVTGPRGAGKTTFVNALIGQQTIPIDTAVPHLLRYGKQPGGRVHFRTGRIIELHFDDLSHFLATETLSATDIRLVEILLPIDELVVASVLDIPGGLNETRTAELLGAADAALWLVGADQPPEHWDEAADFVRRRAVDCLAVLSRIDTVSDEVLQTRLAAARDHLGDAAKAIIPLSARLGLQGLDTNDVECLRASGFTKLHRVLRNALFSRADLIRQIGAARRIEWVRQTAITRLEQRTRSASAREAQVQVIRTQVQRDRIAFARLAEGEGKARLERALHDAIASLSDELDRLGDGHDDAQLEALRVHIKRQWAMAVLNARADMDGRMSALVDSFFERLDRVFPGGAEPADAARLAGLRGILEGYRMLLLEEVFGRYLAYLEGWLDLAPLAAGLLRNAPNGADPVTTMETLGLRIQAARTPDLVGLGDPLFDGMVEFLTEVEAANRVERVDTTKRLLDPLRRLRP